MPQGSIETSGWNEIYLSFLCLLGAIERPLLVSCICGVPAVHQKLLQLVNATSGHKAKIPAPTEFTFSLPTA